MRYNFDDMENGLQVVNIGDVVIYHDKEYTVVHKHEGGLVNLQANFGMGFYKHDVHPNMLTIIKKSPKIKTFEKFNAEPYAKWKNFFEVGDRVIHKDHSYSGLNIGVGTVVFKKNKENVHIDFENPTRNDCDENCCRDGHCWPTADEYAYKYEFLEPTENYYKNNIRWYHKGKLVKENYEIGDLAIYIGNQYKTRQGETVEILELDPKRTYIIYKIRFKKDGMNHIVSDSSLKEIEQIEQEPNIKWYHKGKFSKS